MPPRRALRRRAAQARGRIELACDLDYADRSTQGFRPAMESKPESKHEADRGHRHQGVKLRLPLKVTTISWWDLAHTLGPILLASAAAIYLALHFVRPAPPHTLIMSGGPKGSSFERVAERYRAILAENDIDLKVIPSAGSLQNLD